MTGSSDPKTGFRVTSSGWVEDDLLGEHEPFRQWRVTDGDDQVVMYLALPADVDALDALLVARTAFFGEDLNNAVGLKYLRP